MESAATTAGPAMPRPPRVHVPGAIYHVTLRGNHRRRIFELPSDYRRMESLLEEVVDDHDLKVHAYCWMPNHIHLALQVAEQPLGRPMQRLASRYARHFQARLGTTGHLFERRYHPVLIDSDSYLFALIRYIHLNPVRAALVARPEDFDWSSHAAYVDGSCPRWLTTSEVMSRLSADANAARMVYDRLMREEPPADELEYLRGNRARDEAPADAGARSTVAPKPDPAALERIIVEECRLFGIAPESLTSPARGRPQALARARITWRALRMGAARSVTEIARRLGRSPSTLSEGLSKARRLQPELFRIP